MERPQSSKLGCGWSGGVSRKEGLRRSELHPLFDQQGLSLSTLRTLLTAQPFAPVASFQLSTSF